MTPKPVDMDEHLLSFPELMSRLETSFDDKKPAGSTGITVEEQKKRLAVYGPNQLAPATKGWIISFDVSASDCRIS